MNKKSAQWPEGSPTILDGKPDNLSESAPIFSSHRREKKNRQGVGTARKRTVNHTWTTAGKVTLTISAESGSAKKKGEKKNPLGRDRQIRRAIGVRGEIANLPNVNHGHGEVNRRVVPQGLSEGQGTTKDNSIIQKNLRAEKSQFTLNLYGPRRSRPKRLLGPGTIREPGIPTGRVNEDSPDWFTKQGEGFNEEKPHDVVAGSFTGGAS